jgi:uncharacterized protein (TIGR04222 family)
MNPFDLRGPEFLVFYWLFSLMTLAGAYYLRRALEAGQVPRVLVEDPYAIALLRKGPVELVTVAVLSLIDRGLLHASKSQLVSATADASDRVQRPLDKAILDWFGTKKSAKSVFEDEVTLSETRHYIETLQSQGLLPDSRLKTKRQAIFTGGLVILGGLAGIKLWVALMRGRSNVGFLIVSAIVLGVVLYALTSPRLTVLGRQALRDMRGLFQQLKGRRASLPLSSHTNELVYLAAVFGMAALPAAAQAAMTPLQLVPPRKPPSDGGAGWSSCGGSSCGGSSCGGGGGGGGCGGGGCGGCGS